MAQEFAELEVVINGRPAKQELGQIGRALDEVGDKADKASNQTVGAFDKVKKSLFSLKNLLVSLGVITLFSTVIRTNAEFEQSLANVKATLFATSQEMERLETVARKMGKETVFSATQAADAMGFLAQGGLSVNQIIDAMPGTLSLAAAGSLQLGQAATIATNAMNAFGLEADKVQHVANVLALGASRTNASVESLGDALSKVGPVLSPLGVKFEEVTAAVGALMNTGLDGSIAGNKLASAMLFLVSPVDDAKRAIRDLNLQLSDLSPQTNTIAEIMTKLRNAKADPRALERIFGKENVGTVLTLMTSQFDTLVKLTGEMKKAADEADRMSKIKMDTLKGSIEQLLGTLEEVALKVGRDGGIASAFRDMVDLATEGVDWIVGNFHELRIAGVWVFGELQKAFSYMVEAWNLSLEDFKLASGLVLTGLEHAFKAMVEIVKAVWSALMQALLLSFEYVLKGIIYSLEQLAKVPGPQQKYLQTAIEGNKSALAYVTQQNAELSKQGDIFDRLAKNNAEHQATAKELLDQWKQATLQINLKGLTERDDFKKGVMEIMTDFFLGRFGRGDIGRGVDPQFKKDSTPKPPPAVVPPAKADPYDRFGIVGEQFKTLAYSKKLLVDEMNNEDWIKQATVDDVKEKSTQIQAVTDEMARQMKANQVSFSDSIASGMRQQIESWGTMSERAQQAGADMVNSLDTNMTNGLTDIIFTTESVGEAFSKMATSIVQDLVRIAIQQFIVRQVLGALFGGFGIGGGGGGGGTAHIGGVAGETRPASFHTGGVTDDSVMIRARRGEGVFTEDQMQALGLAMKGNSGQGGGDTKGVNIVNVNDPSEVPRGVIQNPQTIVNIISQNRRAIKAILDAK